MIQLTHAGLVCAASEADLNRLRAEFDHEHSVVLPALLEPALLRRALHEIEGATFEEHVDDGIGSELRMRDNRASHLLDFLVNDPGLFALIERIAGCGRVGSFIGRVYRALPNSSHFDNWHDDLVDERNPEAETGRRVGSHGSAESRHDRVLRGVDDERRGQRRQRDEHGARGHQRGRAGVHGGADRGGHLR